MNMTWLISDAIESLTKRRSNMKKMAIIIVALLLAACEKAVIDEPQGNVTMTFSVTNSDITRGTVTIGDYFTKLNVMLFDADGQKVFDKVRTQLATDDDFGTLSAALQAGTYTVVAVGHSSLVSATIKSPQMVQFTAKDGQKLTDTFCYCGEVTIGNTPEQFQLKMHRVCAMVDVVATDDTVPDGFARVVIGYTGGSANFNPTTFEGTTKSTQSEARTKADRYQVFTFPYMATTGTLKMTLSMQTADGTVLAVKTINEVPVTRNRITRYTGHLFDDTPGEITETGFGFMVDPEWDGIDDYTF